MRNALFHADSTTGALIPPLPPMVPTSSPTGIAVGPDGNLYVGSSATGQVSRFNPTTGAFGVFGTAPAPIAGLSFGPDGELVRLPVLAQRHRPLRRHDRRVSGFIHPTRRPAPSSPAVQRWGPDGNLWVSANATGEVLRYDGATGAFLGVFAVGTRGPGCARFRPGPALVVRNAAPRRHHLGSGGRLPRVRRAQVPRRSVRRAADRRSALEAAGSQGRVAHRDPRTLPWSGVPAAQRRERSRQRRLPEALDLAAGQSARDAAARAVLHPRRRSRGRIRGGSRTDGSAFALAQNAIVVEPQYRLGALGFFGLPGLAAEDPNGSTGNYGFLDQLEALRWVRDNIAAFGGDPNQVTIAGESAGGWSVCALMASPLSDGLFRAGIVQSGQCYNARALADLPAGSPVLSDPYFGSTIYKRSARRRHERGLRRADDLVCLRAAPAASLVQALGAQPRTINGDPPANPAIDGYFLPEQPLGLLRQGAADHRSLMIGSVANESTYFTRGLEAIVTNAAIYDFGLRSKLGNTRTDALETVYPATNVPSVYPSWAEEIRVLFDDAGTVCPTLDAADAIAQGGSPAWVYHLTFAPTYLASSTNADLRTFHGARSLLRVRDLRAARADYGIATDADDAALSVSMQNAWGSFVRTGVPSTTPAWPVYAPTTPGDLASVSVLNFDVPNTTVAGNLFRSGRCAALFPVANQLDPDRDVADLRRGQLPRHHQHEPGRRRARHRRRRLRQLPQRRQPARRRRLPHDEPLGHAHRRTARRRPRRLRQQVRRQVPRRQPASSSATGT